MIMTTFSDIFKLTEPSDPSAGAIAAVAEFLDGEAPAPGVYNDGLITLLAKGDCANIFAHWPLHESVESVTPLITTGFGDVIFRDPVYGQLHYLELRRTRSGRLGDSVAWLFDEFLTDPMIVNEGLRADLFSDAVQLMRPLHYGECFTAGPVPWIFDSDNPLSYRIGSVSIYVDMVGQTAFGN